MAGKPSTCVCHGKTFPSKKAVIAHYKARNRQRNQEDWDRTFGPFNDRRPEGRRG